MFNFILGAITADQFRLLGLSATGILTLLILIVTLALFVKARGQEKKEQADEELSAEEQPAESVIEENAIETVTEDTSAINEPEGSQVERVEVCEEAAVPEQVEQPEEAPQPAKGDEYPEFIKGYLQKLGSAAKYDFINVVLNNSENLTTRIILPVNEYGEDETAFVDDYFNSLSKFAKPVPAAVHELLYDRFLQLNDDEADRARARRKLISAYYARRGEEDTLFKCEELCKEDAAYYLKTVGVRGRALPTLKKLVEICASQNRYDDAIFWCDTAIENGVIEVGGAGYENRKKRIVLLKKRYEIKTNN